MPSFDNKKQLRFVITLGTGKFGSTDKNQITLEGFRASVSIDKAGGMQMSNLRAKIYGVKQDDMNSITTLNWKPGMWIPNTVEVFAIDGKVESLVFAGNIVNAWGDYQAMPDVCLDISAQAAYYNQLAKVKPFSVKGGISAAVVMSRIAKDMGLAFENNNVDITLTDVYLCSTLTEQAKELARMGDFSLYIDDKVLAITNKYAPRGTAYVPVISKDTGMIGYPTFDGVGGVIFRCLFSPSITFGGKVNLQTDIKQAAGEWIVTSMAHHLESEKPGGAWFSTVRGNSTGLAIVK